MNRALLVLAILSMTACQVTFSSDGAVTNRDSAPRARTLYLPSASDQSSLGGLAARITQALQRELVRYPNIRLTSADEAAVAIDLRVHAQKYTVATVSECVAGDAAEANKKIGSEAYRCGDLQFSAAQSDVASETEVLSAVVRMTAVDLSTGTALLRVETPVSSAPFPVVGSATVAANLVDRPEFHALRYAENRDRARDEVAQAVALRLVPSLLNLYVTP